MATVLGPLDLDRVLVGRASSTWRPALGGDRRGQGVCMELGLWRAQLPRRVLEEEARVSAGPWLDRVNLPVCFLL